MARARKKSRARARARARVPKPYKLGGVALDNRELQDLVEALGMRLVPKEELTPLEELENRLDRMLARAEEAIDAGKKASDDIKQFSATVIPLMNEIKGELGQHRGRLVALETGQVELVRRVSALEQTFATKGI